MPEQDTLHQVSQDMPEQDTLHQVSQDMPEQGTLHQVSQDMPEQGTLHQVSQDPTVVFTDLEFISISHTPDKQSEDANSENQCVICSYPYDAQHMPLRLTCCNQVIGHKCFCIHVLDRKRNFVKHHQTVQGFVAQCPFCKGLPVFEMDNSLCEASLLSTPSTQAPSVIDTESLSLSHIFTEDGSISADVSSGHVICIKCNTAIDNMTDTKACGCCNRIVHRSCAECTEEELKSIKAYQALRGYNCGSCTIDKHMLQESFVYTLGTDVKMQTPHMLACMPDCNYLLSVLVSHACGCTYNKGNPWKSQVYIDTYAEFNALSTRIFLLLSVDDITHFRNDVLRNVKGLRNVFVPSSTLYEFLSRDPVIKKAVFEFCYKVHLDACSLYAKKDVHALQKIHDNIIDSIVGVQGYMVCIELFCLFLCY